MNTALQLLTGLLLAACTCQGNELKLEPNAILHFAFPELPDTLYAKATGNNKPPLLTAQLPNNYATGTNLPLFVFLNGGNGGPTDSPVGREIVGQRDFICVALPLFKRSFDTNEAGGLLISMEDFDTISRSYRMMLQKLLDAVPNISSTRSVLGGVSNGAHTTGVLVAGQDEFILRQFRSFFFWEGGADMLAGHALEKASARHHRFLMLQGDQPSKDKGEPLFREYYTHIAQALECVAKELHLDFTSVVVRGYGHEFPSNYFPLINRWARDEKLPGAFKNSVTSTDRSEPF